MDMVKSLAVIIAAGGTGSRMGENLPKQFLNVGGKPMIVRSMEAFAPFAEYYIVSITPGYSGHLLDILTPELKSRTLIADGGQTRYESVKRALALVPDGIELVAVHDAARPFVDAATIERAMKSASETGSALPVIPLVDSIRRVFPDGSSTAENRSAFVAVQTPQVFKTEILKQAYEKPYDPRYSDDASLVESTGYRISLVEGSADNIKVTFKKDLR